MRRHSTSPLAPPFAKYGSNKQTLLSHHLIELLVVLHLQIVVLARCQIHVDAVIPGLGNDKFVLFKRLQRTTK